MSSVLASNESEFVQTLVLLWMTRSITDDIPGWGVLFNGRAGDGTVNVSNQTSKLDHKQNLKHITYYGPVSST